MESGNDSFGRVSGYPDLLNLHHEVSTKNINNNNKKCHKQVAFILNYEKLFKYT